MPSGPEPVAAVDPACGLARLGNASPVTAGEDADTGAEADVGELAAVGNDVELPVDDDAAAGEDAPLAGVAVSVAALPLPLPPQATGLAQPSPFATRGPR